MSNREKIIASLETLAGRKSEPSSLFDRLTFNKELNLGFSQFNEILLLLGFDRVNEFFFDFLCGKGKTIKSIEDLEEGVLRFVRLSMLLFGNVRHAFSTLSNDRAEFEKWIDVMKPLDESRFRDRHDPILNIERIDSDKTYFLGYIVQAEIEINLSKNPHDEKALTEKAIRDQTVEQGKKNQEAYLASDHMDVYIATSMRQKHEYLMVSKIADDIFNNSIVKDLKLRYFDPTQAYCEDRIDKGLSEGLMLKRARCTIYLAQESDTLGKDSELASTLAQGKPVIAFIPLGDRAYVEYLIGNLLSLNNNKSRRETILGQLQVFAPNLAWDFPEILLKDEGILFDKLVSIVKEYYDKRARTLSETHPLGLQVNLSTGVANGVLVVRTIDQCCKLLKNIVTNNLEFDLEKKIVGGETYLLLREKVSGCVYRAITANKSLTNSFWNYYLD